MEQLLDASALYDQYAFQNALPIPDVIDTSKHKTITLQVQEIEQFLGLYGQDGLPLDTTVWGYGTGQNASYPGPTILAYQDQPITVNWQNKLTVDGHLLPVDTSLHMADPIRRPLEAGFVPTVTHLHGYQAHRIERTGESVRKTRAGAESVRASSSGSAE